MFFVEPKSMLVFGGEEEWECDAGKIKDKCTKTKVDVKFRGFRGFTYGNGHSLPPRPHQLLTCS